MELRLSRLIEKSLTKDQILALYLNVIYLGNGVYGVEAASRDLFGKSVKDVTIAEGKKLIGTTPVFTGGSKSLTLQLKPGTYTFFCSVPGHRQAGMQGTLTVQ